MTSIDVRPWDFLIVGVYLTATVCTGLYVTRRNNSTEEYFLGGRSFPGWMLGISMLGTIVSSVTFLALPAAAFTLDWRQLVVNFPLPLVAVLAIVLFIPFFRRAGLTSAFEYLGLRYGAVPRVYGTLSFVVMQLIRMAQILFLVSIPIEFLTGMPMHWVILTAGLLVAAYTVAGGFDAVVWTDVIQTIVLVLGGIVCLTIVVLQLPRGIQQVIEVGSAADKFSLGDFHWNLDQRTFWTVAILGLVNWLAIYSGDQNLVQRYAAAKSLREARKATALYSCLAMPLWASFFFLGTAVFVYYQTFPDPAVAELQADQVLPYFILTQVPQGVAGLILAAVMAAAMSTLDSGVNSITTVVVVDLLKPYLLRGRSDRVYLRAAKVIAAFIAAAIIGGAIFFSQIEKESMNDISLIATSVFGGCLMGLFLLGFFTTRVDVTAAVIGLVAAMLFNIYLALGLLGRLPEPLTLGVHSYWVGPLVNLAFALIAYGIGFVRAPSPSRDLTGLTVWTMPRAAATADNSAPSG